MTDHHEIIYPFIGGFAKGFAEGYPEYEEIYEMDANTQFIYGHDDAHDDVIEEEEEQEYSDYDAYVHDSDHDSDHDHDHNCEHEDLESAIQYYAAEAETTTAEKQQPKVPKRVFIVPYRNRPQHKFFFTKHMSYILEDETDYEIYFSHQCDQRTFNRGAVKNIGFLAIKEKYPHHYKQITFIFNDVDTIPFNKLFDYETTQGTVKHYYGYNYALGGIVVIKGADFEAINGYPCYWGWGMEDNILQRRCVANRLRIDRSNFYEIGSPEILQLFDGISRIVSKKDPYRIRKDNIKDGLNHIAALQYSFSYASKNPADNVHLVPAMAHSTYYINIDKFEVYESFDIANANFYVYDLREPTKKIMDPNSAQIKTATDFMASPQEWTKIPYYPTMKENRENAAKALIKAGKAIPQSLAKQIELDRIHELNTDVYNSTYAAAKRSIPPRVVVKPHVPSPPMTAYQALLNSNGGHVGHHGIPPTHFVNVQQQQVKQQLLNKRLIAAVGGNKYSPMYAKLVGTRERATKSANIGLGGIISSHR